MLSRDEAERHRACRRRRRLDDDRRAALAVHLDRRARRRAARETQRDVAVWPRLRPADRVSPDFLAQLSVRLDEAAGWLGMADWRVDAAPDAGRGGARPGDPVRRIVARFVHHDRRVDGRLGGQRGGGAVAVRSQRRFGAGVAGDRRAAGERSGSTRRWHPQIEPWLTAKYASGSRSSFSSCSRSDWRAACSSADGCRASVPSIGCCAGRATCRRARSTDAAAVDARRAGRATGA